MRYAGNVNRQAIVEGCCAAQPGKTLLEVDDVIEKYILKNGCKPAFKGYKPPGMALAYPKTACLSPNEVVVHGVPNNYVLKPGDLLTIDVGTEYNGFYVDSARSYIIPGALNTKGTYLITATEAILEAQLSVIRNECTFIEIIEASERMAQQYGVTIFPMWHGHYIGEAVHLEPSIPSTIDRTKSKIQQQLEYNRYSRMIFKENDTVCLEPVVCYGNSDIILDEDMWTVRKTDGQLACHSERCLIVTKNGYQILS